MDDLYDAAIAGDIDAIAKLEMKAGKLNKYGGTILHKQSGRGNTVRVKFILTKFASKNLLVKLDRGKETALHIAAYNGHTEVAEILIDAARYLPPSSSDYDNPVTSFQAFLRKPDENMNTALHLAVMKGQLDIVKLLVEADVDDGHIQNITGRTPMYIAVERGYNDIVAIISATCPAPSLDGPNGSTALPIKNLDKGENPGRPVYKIVDRNALYAAARDGDANAKAKLEMDADKLDSDGGTILHIESQKGNTEHVRFILRELANKKLLVKLNRYQQTALHLAIYPGGHCEVVKLLVDAARHLPRSFCQAFLRQGDRFMNSTALHLAVRKSRVDIVKLIVEADPTDRHTKNSHGETPIYLAAENGNTEIVKVICTTCTTPFNLDGPDGSTALHAAVKNLHQEAVVVMLNDDYAGILVKLVDNRGWTALHHAVDHKLHSVIEPIIEEQKRRKHPFVYKDRTLTPFHIAGEKGYTSIIMLLMQFWPSWSSACTAADKYGKNVLHLAALQSNKEMIQGILTSCGEKYKKELVNKQDDDGNTPLHLLMGRGCLVPELLKYGLDIRVKNKERQTPLDMLYVEDQIIDDQVKIKVTLDRIQIDQKKDFFSSSVFSITKREKKDVLIQEQAKQMILEKNGQLKEDTRAVANCFSDAIAGDPISIAALEMEADIVNKEGKTILHVESNRGDAARVRFIAKEFANKNLLLKLDTSKQTALHLAAQHGHTHVVEVLLDAAARHLPEVSSFYAFIRQASGPVWNTALHIAVLNGNLDIVKFLIERDPNDRHAQNYEGKTPIFIAAENGYKDIMKEMCRTCRALSLDGPGGRTTALHVLIQNIGQDEEEYRDVIRMMIDAAKSWTPQDSIFEALFTRTNESGSTILELAVYRNCVEVVELILAQNPAYQHSSGSNNIGFMHLIYTAIDNKYEGILKLLTKTYEAKVSVVHKGVTDLIVAIRRRDRVSVIRQLEDNKQLVTFVDEDGWTPLHHAAEHEFDSILGPIIEAQKDVGHQFLYKDKDVSTPFHVAAKKRYTFTVMLLMELWPSWSSAYIDVDKESRNILHWAAVESEKEMIQGILKYCPEKYKSQIVNKQDNNGDTPLHLLIARGCFIPELINYKGLDTMIKNKNDQTALDYFYLEDEIIADQVRIKIALDDIETDQYWKFWHKNTKKKSNYLDSVVLPSRRKTKDVQFEIAKKKLMDEKHGQMKKDLERYKKRTNTQIIVTALITTVTFTVGFTMPGGLHQSGELDQGLVVLSRKTAFNAFMVSDALAFLLSTCCLFLYFLESMYEDPRQVSKINAASTGLNIVSVVAMMLTFITGTYVVLSHSLALAITVCIIGSFFFLFVIVLLIKMFYDRRVKRNED